MNPGLKTIMDIVVDQKQISSEEKNQISMQVRADLVDHLYKGCLPGTLTGIFTSILMFIVYTGNTSQYWLILWMIEFNIMMVSLSALFFFYVRFKYALSLPAWETAYSIVMTGCALSWLPSVLLMPVSRTHESLALLVIFLASTGYATGTIGQFRLGATTLNIILIPVAVWSFHHGGTYYNIVGGYSIIYSLFLTGINLRSTEWFKESLKLKLENTLVSYQANHDLLTGLPNQRLLPQYIEAALKAVKNSDKSIALVCFSLNRLEFINDSLGYAAGDSIIRSVAERLKILSERDRNDPVRMILTLSRKDTFNILLVPVDEGQIEARIKDIFSVLKDSFYLETQSIMMTASAGISLYPKDNADPQALISNADAVMFKAKQYGGNRHEYYRQEINAEIPKQVEMEADLHNAIEQKQFVTFYQPLIDMNTGEIAGMEALIRWNHPVHGFISPAHFIPLAEDTGLIVPIGEWIMEDACAQTKKWVDMGFRQLKVAINVAEKQLREENFIGTIERILEKTGLDPFHMELEITETAILDEALLRVIKEFKRIGLRLAVDDFGTGYSGLSYLKRFEVDKIKIDQSFVKDIPQNEESMTIVSAILAMAKELNVTTLAEGVETEEQLRFLKNKECDYVQGYYFSKPIDAKSFYELLSTYRGCPALSTERLEYEGIRQ